MYTYKKISLLFFVFVSSILFGTALSGQNVIGYVKDIQSKEPLLFANVVLVKASDSSQVTGTSSDSEGKFTFQKTSKGQYFIQVSTLGYHRGNSSVFEIKADTKSMDVGAIELSPSSVQLNEVEIRVKRPLIEMAPGKIVMNVADHLASQMADNAFEMLKKFPGIAIDNDDNISLNGKSGVMVMVDGRNTYLSGTDLANYLKAMPAQSVASIEAIANPSSKYDAEGVSGIIDIKTGKQREKGFNGSVSAGVGADFRGNIKTNESVDINFRSNKVSVYGNLSYFYGKGANDFHTYTNYSDGSQMNYNSGEGEDWVSSSRWSGMWARAGADFYPTNKDVIGVSYKGSGNWSNNLFNGYTRWLNPEGLTINSALQGAESKWTRQNHNVSANYEHTFDTVFNRKIFADFTWIRGLTGGGGSNDLTYYTGDFDSIRGYEAYNLDQPLISDIYALKIDYEHPFNQQTKLEVGIKGSFVNNNNNMEYIVDGMRDTSRSNRYLYNEWIGAAYAMINHSFPTKTSLQVGVRAEITGLSGYNVELDSTNKNLYCRPFPNVNISQQIGNNHRLNLSYRYRLNRPSYSYLNPFLLRAEATAWNGGNPYLKPEYSHNLDLTYSYKYNLFITLGYTHTDDNINHMTYYENINGTNISTTLPQNLGTGDLLSLSINGQFTFFERWRMRFYLSGSYGRQEFYYGVNEENRTKQITNTFNSSVWFSTDVDIIPSLTAELSCWGQLPSRDMFSSDGGYFSLNLSVKKTFFKEKLTLTLSANDLIGMKWKNKSNFPDGTNSHGYYRWGGQQVFLSVSYRFGNNKLMNRAPRSRSVGQEENSRMGGDSGQGGVGK